jgi:uncharacterized protein (TIGR02246 family)
VDIDLLLSERTQMKRGDRLLVVHPEGMDPGDALAAIEALVARLQTAQQSEDVAGFIALFAEHAVWTTGHGKRLVGRDAIHDFTKTVLPGAMRESTARYDVERIALLRPDVAVVTVRQRTITPQGAPLEHAPEGRPTYVLTREGDEWLIAAAQNTQVAEP